MSIDDIVNPFAWDPWVWWLVFVVLTFLAYASGALIHRWIFRDDKRRRL